MATKHTPGPWQLDTVKTAVGICHRIGNGQFPGRGNKENYACVYVDGAVPGHPSGRDLELEANARLIAAAPELLAACKSLLNWPSPHTASDVEEQQDIVGRASAAIRKAEGT